MSRQDTIPSELCRIDGLTSEAGRKKNGSAGRVAQQDLHQDGDAQRHPVILDGFSGPLSIKKSNIHILSPNGRELSVGVGRGTILDTSFKAALVEKSQVAYQATITGGAARSRGNLAVMEGFVNTIHHSSKRKTPTLIRLTDLNIARAFNRVFHGDLNVKLATPLQEKFQSLKNKLLNNEGASSKHVDIVVKYEPHRIHEDRFESMKDRCGPQRYQAVKHGSYQIYPCSLKQYLDALEVRYADPTTNHVTIAHEIYLDYGEQEAIAYAQHVVAMDEAYRLSPTVLAQVDPQAFWAAILWSPSFIHALEGLGLAAELIQEWKDLEKGRRKSKSDLEKAMLAFGYNTVELKGPKEHWGISQGSTDIHVRVATDFAMGAIGAVQMAVAESASNASSLTINTLDYFIGTEYDKYITGSHKFHELCRQEEEATGTGKVPPERCLKLLDKAMKSAGFCRDSSVRSVLRDPEKTCGNCGHKSKRKLFACARCEGAWYCNAKCQKEHWKQHRSGCSRILVQLKKKLAEIAIEPDFPTVKAAKFKSGSIPTEPGMISEVSGVGFMSIFWNPGSTSIINKGQLNLSSLDTLKPEDMMKSAISFNDFSGLPPTLRFLLCCGPLPSIEVAQDCVDQAIRDCNGNICGLRVPNLGFTALEWAAKKGNKEIVEWLTSDPRTKTLVHIGCPIAWAGYTGKVEIMRHLKECGSDPNCSDHILFGGTPPMMVAGQNGQLESLKFYVNECDQAVDMVDHTGRDLLSHIKDSPSWRDIPGHVAAHAWAKALMKRQKK